MSNLRTYQRELVSNVDAEFDAGKNAVMMQSATGSGKTVVIGHFAKTHAARPRDPRYTGGVAIAHRSELVGQISMQLAREDVPHDIVAPQATIRNIVNNHIEELGRTFYNARAPWRVASVDTINRRKDMQAWCNSVGLGFVDEAHHVLRDNKWGRATSMFPNAKWLLPTATPIRADGAGLGADEQGIADALVEGPPMRWLIDNGFLTDYKIYSIKPSDLNLDGVEVGASGEFKQAQLSEAVRASNAIVGDVVKTYCEHARSKLGVTFAVDIIEAQKITDAFNAAGVPAALVTAETPDDERVRILRKFRNRELWQLVNVDLFGEGFDLPAIECVSFARPTASFALYSQQWGRALRLMISAVLQAAWDTYSSEQRLAFIAGSEKPFAFIFDHVGNFYRHEGPPDKPRVWQLTGRSRRNKSDGIPMRICLSPKCAKPFERFYVCCPYCGTAVPEPVRGEPNLVDGDLGLVTPEILAMMMRERDRIDAPPVVPAGVPRMPVIARHMTRQRAQHYLRETIDYWAGSYASDADRVNYRRFWHTFGIDVLSAQALNEADADALRAKIVADLTRRDILPPVINETN